ncbi:NOTCH2 [Branchiostoma lanceolatum]|uniref:NOTCH2 protein n=1 Tax=Branchiostoma lanceolatum TaxID=7740 RepID=A0A8S4MN26_BRALA|nr:NOTCH2 [Branchiostoma lanceolatum]
MQTHRGIILLLWGLVAIQLTCHQAAAKETPDSDTNLTPDQAGAPGSSGGASDGADPDSTVGTAEGNKPAAFETGEVDTLELGKPVDGGVSSTGNRAAPAGHKLILVADSTDRTITRLTTDDDNSYQWARYSIGNATNRPTAVDYDRTGDFVYWTSVNGANSRVSRFPYETGPGLRLDGGQASVPDGIAVDVISRNLYWTDTGTDRITVSRLDGSFRKSLITQGLDEPRAIVVDPNSGWMYWTDWGNPSKIERARMDGTQGSVIVNVVQGHWPNGLALDAAANRLYWCNGGTGEIWTSGVTGSNPSPAKLLTHANAHLFGIAVDETYIYWTAWNIPGVHRISKLLQGYLKLSIPHFQKLNDIHVRTTSNTPSQPNACSTSNGNCAQLCLPVPGGGRTCACQDGWSLGSDGRSCISAACRPNPCRNSGRCIGQDNSYTCDCPAGFSGVSCQININECASSPCQNGGQCRDGVNRYTCVCPAGFSGVNCQVNINECASRPCQNGGQCRDGVNRYTCVCPAGFNGVNCQTNINECASRPCQNGGQCRDGVNRYTCVCPPGFSGVNCQIDDVCTPSPCQNGGRCVDGVNSYSCVCPDGFLGQRCEISATTAATTFASTGTSSVCESGWLHHEGKCYCLLEDQSTYSEAARTCADLDVYGQLAVVKRPSTHRFLMDYVQHVGGGSPWIGIDDSTTEGVWKYVDDVLVSDPFNEWAEGTWNSRKKDCVRMSETFGYHWQPMPCNSQLTYICEYPLQPPTDAPTPTPTDVERCEPDTCNQGGICIDGPSSYTCYCLPGYVGDNCETETNECEPNPCQNGGVCTDGRLSYTCKCPSGFGGVNCELTCPAGFRLFQDQCFWFSPTPVRKNVAAAETDCDARGARLACVKDEETHNFLKMTIATTNRRPYWIGLSDRVEEGTWRHSDGTALGSFRPFRPGNSNSGWRDCVLIWPASAYQWLYYTCGSRRNFICQKAASP